MGSNQEDRQGSEKKDYRSYLVNLFTLTQLLERAREVPLHLCVAFMDEEKAVLHALRK